jgi:5-methylcytosine-specific restriction protein A
VDKTSDSPPTADTSAVSKKRNPAWSREELILALDLYLKNRQALPGPNADDVLALSEFLGTLGRTLGGAQSETFRNANGVSMKLQNFKRFDPIYSIEGKVGLPKGNKDEQNVWRDFSDDEALLSAVVLAIRRTVQVHSDDGELATPTDLDVTEAAEGQLLTRLHRFRERSGSLVERRKQLALLEHGMLACEACGFNFSTRYGEIGEGLIEVHHTIPLHTLTAGQSTRLSDLALLCANCHRVVHSRKKWLSLPQLKQSLCANDPSDEFEQ